MTLTWCGWSLFVTSTRWCLCWWSLVRALSRCWKGSTQLCVTSCNFCCFPHPGHLFLPIDYSSQQSRVLLLPLSYLYTQFCSSTSHINALKKKKKKITYCWLRWVFIAARRLSLVAMSRGYALAAMRGAFFCCGAWALEHAGFGSCGVWALLPCQHVQSSWTRDPALQGEFLNHWTTREDPGLLLQKSFLCSSFWKELLSIHGFLK